MHILDSYFIPGGFVRIAPIPINGSIIDAVRATSLYGTAFLVSHILGEQGFETPMADEITNWLKPDPSGRAAWTPGV
jgi:hypothetical protein